MFQLAKQVGLIKLSEFLYKIKLLYLLLSP